MPVKFNQYIAAEEAFLARYGEWLRKYPNLGLLAESKIREEFDRSNGRRSHERKTKPVKQYLPSYGNWRAVTYRAALNCWLNLPIRRSVPAPSVFFYWLKETKGSITSAADSLGFHINRGDAKVWNSFHGNRVRLQTVTAVSPALWSSYEKVYSSIEQDLEVENSLSNCSQIERHVAKEVDRVAKLISRTNTKYIVIGSDQSPYNRILCQAANLAGARSAVIGHGYFESPHLGGVLPVYADRLFVWTRQQLEQVHEVMRDEEKQKVVWGGFPYPVNRAKHDGKSVLLVLDDIPNADPDAWWRAYDAVLNGLVVDGWQVTVRPRRSSEVAIFRERSPNLSIGVQKTALYDEFDQVSMVVGGRSSVTVQAAYYGLESVRVLEWTDERQTGEGIERVMAEEVPGYLRSIRQSGQGNAAQRVELSLDKIVKVLDLV